jgi:hypothetical protein
MPTMQDDPRTPTSTLGMEKIDPATHPNRITGDPLAADLSLLGGMWPHRKKGVGAADFLLMDALNTNYGWKLVGAGVPKLVPDGINGTSALLFGDGTPELPATAEANGAIRFDDLPVLGQAGTVTWVHRIGALGKGCVWATIPIVSGFLGCTITNAGYVELTLGGPGRIVRRDVPIPGQAAEMWTLGWRPDVNPDGTQVTVFNVFRNKVRVGAADIRLPQRVVAGRPMIGAHGNAGATPGAPATNLYMGEWYPDAEDLTTPANAPRLALRHDRLNWRHQLGLT